MSTYIDDFTEEILESLADYAHSAWSGWMEYLFKLSTKNNDGSITIPKELVDRWTFQLKTSYNELPEDMKKSDKIEANRMLSIMTNKLFQCFNNLLMI